jgi:hypothetical protein
VDSRNFTFANKAAGEACGAPSSLAEKRRIGVSPQFSRYRRVQNFL